MPSSATTSSARSSPPRLRPRPTLSPPSTTTSPPLFHPHVQTADLLRSLRILEKYTPPQLLLDSKCGYTGFTPACQRDAKRILDSFFLSCASADDLPWDLVDDDAAIRTDFSQVAIAIDSITVGRFRAVFW